MQSKDIWIYHPHTYCYGRSISTKLSMLKRSPAKISLEDINQTVNAKEVSSKHVFGSVRGSQISVSLSGLGPSSDNASWLAVLLSCCHATQGLEKQSLRERSDRTEALNLWDGGAEVLAGLGVGVWVVVCRA